MKKKEALIIVDYQNDFAHEKGSLYVNGGEKLLGYINHIIGEIKLKAGIIISTQDWHPNNHTSFACMHNIPNFSTFNNEVKWPVHCVQNTWGSEFFSGLDINSIDRKIIKGFNVDKECYSGFGGIEKTSKKTLNEVLLEEKIKILHIVGLATDFCVSSTAEDAIKNKYEVNLHIRGIAGVYATPESYEAIPNMQKKGVKIFT